MKVKSVLKTVGLVAVVAASIATPVILIDAMEIAGNDRKGIKKSMADASRSEETANAVKEAKELEKTYRDICSRKDQEYQGEIRKFKADINYDSTKKAAKDELASKVESYKSTISYSSKKNFICHEYDTALATWKYEKQYDSKMVKLKAKRDALVSDYCRIKSSTEVFTDEAMKTIVLDNAKKAYDANKRTVDEEIAALKAEYDSAKALLDSAKNSKLAELNARVTEYEKSISGDIQKKMEGLDTEVTAKKMEVREALNEKYGDDISSAQNAYKKADSVAQEALAKEAEAVNKTVSNMTDGEAIAYSLKERGWSKSDVILVASIPFVPVLYFGIKYIRVVVDVVANM